MGTTLRSRRARRRGGLVAAAAIAILTVLAGAAAPAQAGSPESGPADLARSLVMSADMYLDCGALSGAPLTYAVSKNYCTADGRTGVDGTGAPQGTAHGDCGTSGVWVDNAGPTGQAVFTYSFTSSKGTVIFRDLWVSWDNIDTLGSGGFNDSGFMSSGTYFGVHRDWTSPGTVFAVMTGSVTLWWGGTCSIARPSALGEVF